MRSQYCTDTYIYIFLGLKSQVDRRIMAFRTCIIMYRKYLVQQWKDDTRSGIVWLTYVVLRVHFNARDNGYMRCGRT